MKFEVWDVGAGEDESREVEADDVEEAATKYAEKSLYDGGCESSHFELVVRDEAGVEHAIDVTIEWTPDFYAWERKPAPEPK